MVLRRPVGLSLPNTRQVVSLLKALSARLKNKCLVVAVLQRAPDPWNPTLNGYQGEPISTFCSIACPQVWNADGHDERRRREFAEIREQFYVLSGLVRIPPTGDRPTESREEAIRFFYDLYGLEHLKTYVCVRCLGSPLAQSPLKLSSVMLLSSEGCPRTFMMRHLKNWMLRPQQSLY
ncbi:hypothetical protein EDD15DRAFT_1648157 [Pisolithus albus]|nr:hypothetical protein EDD15DRAFT_1648157 [Pisolithus albus]